MSDPVDHALLQLKLKKALPNQPRLITLRHSLSGAEKIVEYLGMMGEPLRAQIHWPIAGDYLVAPRSGTILGTGKASERLRLWQVVPEDHEFLKREWRLARARAQCSGERIRKCQ